MVDGPLPGDDDRFVRGGRGPAGPDPLVGPVSPARLVPPSAKLVALDSVRRCAHHLVTDEQRYALVDAAVALVERGASFSAMELLTIVMSSTDAGLAVADLDAALTVPTPRSMT